MEIRNDYNEIEVLIKEYDDRLQLFVERQRKNANTANFMDLNLSKDELEVLIDYLQGFL